MARKVSTIHSHLYGHQVRPLIISEDDAEDFEQFVALGIDMLGAMDASDINAQIEAFAADDLVQTSLTTTSGIPVTFLQAWMPGLVRLLTAPRKIDELIGVTTVGSWEDEEVIQGVLEPTGIAVPYTDLGNIPLANWNLNYERRTIIRFEAGLRVGKLEEARAAKARINSAAEKRNGASVALDIQRNRVGFLGYNGGANRTYGFLNDPILPNYVTVANGAATTPQWSTKTYLEIVKDIQSFVAALRLSSGGNINLMGPGGARATLAIADNAYDYLSTVSVYGNSVLDWINKTYPNLRIVSAPELNLANGGANVAYIWVDRVEDGSSDGGAVWSQNVPARFFTIGTEQQAKAYVEDFGNALGGVMVKRGFAVRRFSGI